MHRVWGSNNQNVQYSLEQNARPAKRVGLHKIQQTKTQQLRLESATAVIKGVILMTLQTQSKNQGQDVHTNKEWLRHV